MTKFEDAVEQVLAAKSPEVFFVDPSATVFEAIQLMAERAVGAVLVLDGCRLAGILSERDYARKIILKGRRSAETKVSDVMTSPVVTVGPEATVDECMRLMTVRRFRHLPVIDKGLVRGVVSIGDLVKWVITSQERTIRQLEDYIAGKYPG